MSDVTPSGKTKLPKVDLGSNSLLLIALIVTVCSGSEHGSDRETRRKLDELHETVTQLEKKVDALSTTMRRESGEPNPQSAADAQPQ